MARTKTIVISDVHLSDGATSYSWFKDGRILKDFLSKTAKRADVKELVLLGDFFDLWLYPVNIKPWTAQRVIQQWNSGADSVIGALKECADKLPDVFYINGNHDMGVTAADLAQVSPKIKCVTSDQYNAAHANALHLEHGHMVDMFNAPDISDDGIGGLPFGYFITRLVATAQNHDEIWDALRETVAFHRNKINRQHSFIQKTKISGLDGLFHSVEDALIEYILRDAGKVLIEAIIDLLIVYVKAYDTSFNTSSKIILPDMSTVTVGDVRNRYHTLLLKWYQKLDSPIDLYHCALASENLDWHAEKLLQSGPAKLVVMGHTHAGKSLFRAEGQYANSGCWVAQKQATYVEIDTAASPKAVVKVWPSDTPLAPAILFASPASITSRSQPMPEEEAWEEEPLPPLWQQGSDQIK